MELRGFYWVVFSFNLSAVFTGGFGFVVRCSVWCAYFVFGVVFFLCWFCMG